MVKAGETTLALDAEHDDRCPTCSARANSCDIRVWLSGRSCCSPCTGPRSHYRGDGAVHGDPGHLDRVDPYRLGRDATESITSSITTTCTSSTTTKEEL